MTGGATMATPRTVEAIGTGRRGGRPAPRWEEPRWFTLADLAWIVAALALGLATRNLRFEPVMLRVDWGSGARQVLSVFWSAADGVAVAGLATTLAILARRGRYGGTPRPAEWLPIVLATSLACQYLGLEPRWPAAGPVAARGGVAWIRYTGEFDAVGGVPEPPANDAWDRWRFRSWDLAQAAPATVVVGVLALALSPAGRRPLGRTLVITGMLGALLCGPILLLETRIPGWFVFRATGRVAWTRISGSRVVFGPVAQVIRYWLPGNGAVAIGKLPRGVFYGVPAMAALLNRFRLERPGWVWTAWPGLGAIAQVRRRWRPWTWTEWAGLLIAGMMALYWLLDALVVAADRSNPDRVPDLVVRGLWLAAVALISGLIVLGLGWDRGDVPGPDDRGSDPREADF